MFHVLGKTAIVFKNHPFHRRNPRVKRALPVYTQREKRKNPSPFTFGCKQLIISVLLRFWSVEPPSPPFTVCHHEVVTSFSEVVTSFSEVVTAFSEVVSSFRKVVTAFYYIGDGWWMFILWWFWCNSLTFSHLWQRWRVKDFFFFLFWYYVVARGLLSIIIRWPWQRAKYMIHIIKEDCRKVRTFAADYQNQRKNLVVNDENDEANRPLVLITAG